MAEARFDHRAGAVDRVREHEVEVLGPVDFDDVAISYYFLDPDGHVLELWSPNPGSSAEAPVSGAQSEP